MRKALAQNILILFIGSIFGIFFEEVKLANSNWHGRKSNLR